jgi:hypothetical protein
LSPIDPEVAVPESRLPRSYRRWLSALVGITALCITGLTWVEADSGRKEERAFITASRDALDIFVKLAASAPRAQFGANSLRRALMVREEGLGRVLATGTGNDGLFAAALSQSRAAERAADRLTAVAEEMSSVPDEVPKLDPATLEAVRISNPAEILPLVDEQNQAVDDADEYGTRESRSFFSLGLTASAAALLGLAGLMGASRAGRISMVTAAVALLVAVVWTGVAFVF